LCGNGIVEPGEECDDGNTDSSDACAACETASCGDGFVHKGSEECDDANGEDNDGCIFSLGCKFARCGDGIIYEGVEQCDDGNQDNADFCTDACTVPYCGDGIINGHEDCDDGNVNDHDLCDNACRLVTKRIFVTDLAFSGALGSVKGADNLCTALAFESELATEQSQKWMAWLSSSLDDGPALRFLVKWQGPYVLANPEQTKIADDWADFTDGLLDHPISKNQYGEDVDLGIDTVWTNTTISGYLNPKDKDCANWASEQNWQSGFQGAIAESTPFWTEAVFAPCSNAGRIICIEQ